MAILRTSEVRVTLASLNV